MVEVELKSKKPFASLILSVLESRDRLTLLSLLFFNLGYKLASSLSVIILQQKYLRLNELSLEIISEEIPISYELPLFDTYQANLGAEYQECYEFYWFSQAHRCQGRVEWEKVFQTSHNQCPKYPFCNRNDHQLRGFQVLCTIWWRYIPWMEVENIFLCMNQSQLVW